MPQGNIAIPFFTELNEKYKDIVTNIENNIYKIKNKRENIYKEWGSTFIEDETVSLRIYKRAVIIATNIAEASITISGLKYVIDNGYSKVNRYDQNLNQTILEVQKISESSRIQRKGRVGRTDDGIVYYMYKKDARKDIPPKYTITQENISIKLLDLLGEKSVNDIKIQDINNYSKLILSPKIDPNFLIFLDLNNIDDMYYTSSSGLFDIYKENYNVPINYFKLDHKEISYNYFIKKSFDQSMYVFKSGQLIMNLLDQTGKFYLIHPFENNLKRNILNQILNFNIIPLSDYKYIISYLFHNNLLIDMNGDSLYMYSYDINRIDRNWFKSELATQIKKISNNIELNIQQTITTIAASAMGCLVEVQEIIEFLKLINNSFKNLHNKNVNIQEFKNFWYDSHVNSDLIFIYNLIKKIKETFSNLFFFNIDNVLFNLLTIFKTYNEKPNNFDSLLWSELTILKNNGLLIKKYKKVMIKNKWILNKLYSNINNNKDTIIKWCDNNLLNQDIIINYIKLNINKNNDFTSFKWSSELNSNFNKQLTEYTIEEKIIRSFIYGHPTQFIYPNNNCDYLTIMNYNYYKINILDTTCIPSNNIIFYLVYNKENEENINELDINILSYISPEWLIPACPLLINPLLKYNVIKDSGYIKYVNSHILQRFNKIINDNWNSNILIWNTEETPLLSLFYKLIYKYINNNKIWSFNKN